MSPRRSASSISLQRNWQRRGLLTLLAVASSLLSCVAADSSTTTTVSLQSENQDYLAYCRTHGFDPFQLSCDTCAMILSNDICTKCCQPYKNVNTRVERHAYALLVYVPNSFQSQRMRMFGGTQDDEVLQLLEDKDALDEIPAGRFRSVRIQESEAYKNHMAASTLYWLDAPPPKSVLDSPHQATKVLEQLAKSQVHVDGWKKDDLKDMLLTLLENK